MVKTPQNKVSSVTVEAYPVEKSPARLHLVRKRAVRKLDFSMFALEGDSNTNKPAPK